MSRKVKKDKDAPKMVMMGTLVFEPDAQVFRARCEEIGANPHDVIYGFIKAVNSMQISIERAGNAPFAQ